MNIDIDRLPAEGLNISRDFELFSGDLVEDNAVSLKPLHADVFIHRVGEEVYVKGHISTSVNFICSRCLSPFEFAVDSHFDLVFLPEELDVMKDQLERDDVNKLFYYSRSLNLEEVVLEQLNLTFPLRPLCSEDCQGICPVCGSLINNGDCFCAQKGTDSRFGKLKILLRDKS